MYDYLRTVGQAGQQVSNHFYSHSIEGTGLRQEEGWSLNRVPWDGAFQNSKKVPLCYARTPDQFSWEGVQMGERPIRKPVVIDPHSLFLILSLSDLFFASQKVIPNYVIVA
jgi:hypothetical protein